jgi:hypothetical protein
MSARLASISSADGASPYQIEPPRASNITAAVAPIHIFAMHSTNLLRFYEDPASHAVPAFIDPLASFPDGSLQFLVFFRRLRRQCERESTGDPPRRSAVQQSFPQFNQFVQFLFNSIDGLDDRAGVRRHLAFEPHHVGGEEAGETLQQFAEELLVVGVKHD